MTPGGPLDSSSAGPAFEIKSFKSWSGREGLGYQGVLAMNGKIACFFQQDGRGGCTDIYFFDASGERLHGGRIPPSGPGPELKAYVDALPVEPDDTGYFPGGRKLDLDGFIDRLAHDRYYELNALRSGNVAFRIADRYHLASGPYTPERRAALLAEHPNAVFLTREFVADPTAAVDKRLQRACRTKTLYRLPGQGPDEYMEVRRPFTPEVRDQILAKHPEAVFINKAFIDVRGLAPAPALGHER